MKGWILALLLCAACAPAPGEDPPDTDGNGCVQDHAGHETCKESLGDMGYCGPDGDCIEASGCEAMNCCVPGAQGDAWCQGNFGEESVCVAGTDGYCSQE
jgi:hypothetical protein